MIMVYSPAWLMICESYAGNVLRLSYTVPLGPSSLAGTRDLKVAYDVAVMKLVLLAVL